MRVFLSYDSRDEKFAEELRQQLGKLGMNVWNPADELYPGDNWLLETGKALERADAVVFLLSPAYSRSKWTRFELQYVLTQKHLAFRVVPVVLGKQARVPWSMRAFSIRPEKQDAAEVAKTIAERLKKSRRAWINELRPRVTAPAANSPRRSARVARTR